MRAFLLENQQRYAQAGRLRESERDQIEEEVGAYVRGCSANIAKLQSMLRSVSAASPAKAVPASADLMAHRQGSVLILSERLGALTTAFDKLRSLRYKQLQQAEANRRRRTPQNATTLSRGAGKATMGNQLRAAFDVVSGGGGHVGREDGPPGSMNGFGAAGNGQMQSQVDAQNVALQAELLNMTDQVQHTERTVREIATLNQMFSTAILQQSEQIEQLYTEAVAATGTIGRANVQLDKAIRANRSGQKCMFILLVLASVMLLFLDWWYS